MDTNLQNYLSLIKGFIHNTEPILEPPVEWERIFEMARLNGTRGIVGYMIIKYQLCQSGKVLETAKEKFANSAGISIRRYAQANRLLKLLNDHEISHTVMKGYKIRDCYPEPALRTFGDIDLLIHKEDRDKVDQIMREHGYHTEKDWEPAYAYKKDTELYEIHTQILDANVTDRLDYIEYFDHAWDFVKQKENFTYEFTNEYHLLYLVAHLAKHIYSGGAGIRMYMDIALFINKYIDQIDWSLFKSYICQIELSRFMDYVYQALDEWLNIRYMDYSPVSETTMNEMLALTVYGGTFGFKNFNAGTKSLQKYNGSVNSVSRIGAVLSMAFPSSDTLKSRYTYLENKPWLLPAAWVHRLFKNRKKIGKKGKMAGQILHADSNEIEKMNQLAKSIGL